ncbi:hypothetical protein LCGC14_0810710 [marine sediment metagenome]|uniref:TIR domain-containing protein n=1 Tax=marine sediment metagenome TaxID=412755 RepID=A0A0F9SUE3_9ZZZZ
MKIFFSYASVDTAEYRIEDIVDFLEFQDDIDQVFYWERDTKGGESFDDYMRNNIKKSELIIVLFTANTTTSIPVFIEIGMSKAFQKKIMPVFDQIDHIVADMQSSRGVQFNSNFRMFCEDLCFKITGKTAKFKESNPMVDYRNELHESFKFNKSSYVEPEVRDVTVTYKEEERKIKKLPLISYRIFEFILFDPINRGSLNVITAASGSGKSIFLNSIKHDILHQEHLSSYIPFSINAENFKLTNDDLLELFYLYLFPDTEERYYKNFEKLVKSGKGVILLDGLSKNSEAYELLTDLHKFALTTNARLIITCRPVIHDFIRRTPKIKEKTHLYELNSFKSSSLFEWVVLNKNDYEQTRHFQAREIYLVLKERVKEHEEKGERVSLPSMMQEFSM